MVEDKERTATKLRVMYFGGDRDRDFRILVNETAVAEVRLDGSRGGRFFSVDYPIPGMVMRKAEGMFTVKFEAQPDSIAGGIYEVRLME